jgi:aspartyl-tRNA(Asn)/glutamyl-tRNA(Gln) amidotransferase subunit A
MDGCFPLAPSFDTAGPMARDVAKCVAMMEALVPGFAAVAAGLDEVTVGVAWLDRADPLVRARVEDVTGLFPNPRAIDLDLPESGTYAAFMAEAAGVHRDLFAEHADLYGENVRTKVERCLALADEEAERASRARAAYVDAYLNAVAGLDLVLAPTLECVAPPTGIGDLALRERMIRLTYPFNFVGCPVLALPCGLAELGLPASVSLAGRRDDDALVLAVGAAVEAALAANRQGG